jgi:uncharacterized membrane protein YcgQ (UPF0703/DUF1980 family)
MKFLCSSVSDFASVRMNALLYIYIYINALLVFVKCYFAFAWRHDIHVDTQIMSKVPTVAVIIAA